MVQVTAAMPEQAFRCAGEGRPVVHEAMVQQLAGMVKAVPHFAEHHPEGLSDRHRVPEVSIVLALALLHQLVCVLCLLGMHLLC